MVFHNVAAFFKARSPASKRLSDPEKGREEPIPPSPVARHDDDHDFTDDGLPTGSTLVQDDETRISQDHPGDDDHMAIDEEQDGNAITQELEREEYPVEDSPIQQDSNRPHVPFSTFSTATSGEIPSSFCGRFWSKLKVFMNTSMSHEDLESYVPRYRHLPILSGIIIPFSILLEIPGLTEHWYTGSGNNTVRPNTLILILGLALSLACCVIANICLFVRFLEKKVKAMTLLCVAFLTIHDVINITALTVFSIEHPYHDGFSYGQAFWMIVVSTSVSSFVNVTLIVDLIRTRNFSDSGSGLTRKQRSLVLSVMVLLCYIGFGAVVQTFLIHELTFLNALYFTVVTIETIGYGDIVPTSTGGRIFTCLFATFGIISLAVTITLTRETVLEALEVSYRKRVRAVRQNRKEAHQKKKIAERWRAAIEWRLRESGRPIWIKDDPEVHQHRRCMKVVHDIWPWMRGHPYYAHSFGAGGRMQPHGMHLNLEALSRAQLETAALETGIPLCFLLPQGFKMPVPRPQDDIHIARIEGMKAARWGTSMPRFVPTEPIGLPMTHARIGRMAVMLETLAFAVTERSFGRVAQAAEPPPRETGDDQGSVGAPYSWSIAEQYEAMRAGMEIEERRAFAARLLVVWIFFIAFWMLGSGIFTVTEGWEFGTAMYSCFIAFSTIGYGDFAPKTPAGRAVFIFWALLGVGTMTILLSILSEAYSYRYKRSLHSSIFSQAVKRYLENSQATSEQSRMNRAQSISRVHESPQEAFSNTHKRVAEQLEALPHQIIRHIRTFTENTQYLMKPEVLADKNETVPDGLRRLLDDVAGTEKISNRIKREILRDRDSRRTLLSINIEEALRQMTDLAEDALQSLQEQDHINAHSSQQEDTNEPS